MECRIEIDDIIPKELLVANYSRTINFICQKCHQIYPIDALERHLTGVNRCPGRPENVKIICPVEACKYHRSKFFKKVKHLRAHYQHCHAPRQFDCTACGAFFRDEVALRSHQKICGRISCDTCNKSFKVAQGAERHKKRYPDHKLASETLDIVRKITRKPKKTARAPSLTIIRYVPSLKNRLVPLLPEGEKSTNTIPEIPRPCVDVSVQTEDAIVLSTDTACVAISTQTSFLKTLNNGPVEHLDLPEQLETNTFGCQAFDDSFLTGTVLTQTEPFYNEAQFSPNQSNLLLESAGTQTEVPSWFDGHTQTDAGIDFNFL